MTVVTKVSSCDFEIKIVANEKIKIANILDTANSKKNGRK